MPPARRRAPRGRRSSPRRAARGSTRRSTSSCSTVPDPLRIGVLVDQFPELSATFTVAEVRQPLRLGHAVRVEPNAHAPHPGSADGVPADYLVDDTLRARL